MKKRAIVVASLVLIANLASAGSYGPGVKVQVLIEAKTSEGTFKDAIYYSKAEFDALSDAQIEAAKAARVTAWVNTVKAARTAPARTITKAELQAQLDELNKQVVELQTKISVAPSVVVK